MKIFILGMYLFEFGSIIFILFTINPSIGEEWTCLDISHGHKDRWAQVKIIITADNGDFVKIHWEEYKSDKYDEIIYKNDYRKRFKDYDRYNSYIDNDDHKSNELRDIPQPIECFDDTDDDELEKRRISSCSNEAVEINTKEERLSFRKREQNKKNKNYNRMDESMHSISSVFTFGHINLDQNI